MTPTRTSDHRFHFVTSASTEQKKSDSFDARASDALVFAKQLFEQRPDWVTFFREVLGVEGAIHSLFPNPEDFKRFEQSDCYGEIQNMIVELRTSQNVAPEKEPMRVITVRLPKSMHESLRVEAHLRQTTMNKLCIAKLLQPLGENVDCI